MKKINISKSAVKRTVAALDEVETAVLGARVRTDLKAGLNGPGCKPGMCPMPLYGIPPLEF